MPKFYEVYGRDVYDQSEVAVAERKAAYCPFTENVCDGGGNRHQTKIKLAGSELREFFNDELSSVIPGICSIWQQKEKCSLIFYKEIMAESFLRKTAFNNTFLSGFTFGNKISVAI